jgi:N-acetylglucosaminyldiphosphoundecaprenol N-acetyl-beta-D-mannosaminyltransferase
VPTLLRQFEPPGPVEVLGLPLRPLRTEELINLLVQRARSGMRTAVCYANAHTANLACREEQFRGVLRDCDVLYADGASLVWASRWSERRLPERMTAADYFRRFATRCAEDGVSLYLLGGREGVVDEAAARLRAAIPGLQIVGSHHGYFAAADSGRIIAEINTTRPDVLVLGLSSPRQEFWLAEHADELTVPVRWCVGGLLDYEAGRERRAPAWLCCMGGEWLFRLLVDPLGKWRRYLIGNPLFVWNTLRWALRRPRTVCCAKAAETAKG